MNPTALHRRAFLACSASCVGGAALFNLLGGVPKATAVEELPHDISSRIATPNLSPSLTEKEVSEVFSPWAEKFEKIAKDKAEIVADLLMKSELLKKQIPKVRKIAFYSLYPVPVAELRSKLTARAAEYGALPRFHDYPVFGSIAIENAEQTNRWADFLRNQVLPESYLLCDFEPRHGVRLSTDTGDIDILVCYKCDQVAHFPAQEPDDSMEEAAFSAVTGLLLDRLFDKQGIERNIPINDAK